MASFFFFIFVVYCKEMWEILFAFKCYWLNMHAPPPCIKEPQAVLSLFLQSNQRPCIWRATRLRFCPWLFLLKDKQYNNSLTNVFIIRKLCVKLLGFKTKTSSICETSSHTGIPNPYNHKCYHAIGHFQVMIECLQTNLRTIICVKWSVILALIRMRQCNNLS